MALTFNSLGSGIKNKRVKLINLTLIFPKNEKKYNQWHTLKKYDQ